LRKFILKRIFYLIVVTLLVSAILFALLKIIPADPIVLLAGERVSGARLEELRRRWGLDKPVYVQYLYWLLNVLRGDLGKSIVMKQPVSYLILSRLPYTLMLTLTALVVSYIIGVFMGILSVLKRGFADRALNVSAVIFYSLPSFWLGIVLMFTFGYHLRLTPISGYQGPQSLILPVATLVIPWSAHVLRVLRTELYEVMSQDFIVTAEAKGLTRYRVVVGHALRLAIIPVTSLFFLELPWVLGGAVAVEIVFGYPGLGSLLYKAILNLDYSLIMGFIFIIAILTVISNTVGDIIVGILDPRVRTSS